MRLAAIALLLVGCWSPEDDQAVRNSALRWTLKHGLYNPDIQCRGSTCNIFYGRGECRSMVAVRCDIEGGDCWSWD